MTRTLLLAGGAAIMTALAVAAPAEEAPLALEGSAAQTPWERSIYGRRWGDRDSTAFNTLANLKASPPAPAPDALRPVPEGLAGDAERGKAIVADRGKGGSCLACHVMGPAGGANLPGNIGPDLSKIALMGRSDEYFYNQIYDPRVFNPDTSMPPWGAHGILDDQEIMDIVAFLQTLDEPVVYPDPRDDPWNRPPPVEDRDGQDPLVNPAMWLVETAVELWERAGPTGESCASCHGAAEDAYPTWAASMPRWEPRLEKILGVEEFVYRHAKATTGDSWLMQSEENTALAIYLRHIANGTPIDVDTESPEAREALARAETLYVAKLGQLNMSCADCHAPEKGANHWVRGQWLGEARGQLPHFPVFRTSRSEIWDIRKRLQWCNVAIWANELPPDAPEYGDLELWLSAQNEGLELNSPNIRH
jgi:sulfur-oxidizing protein SoxA